MVLDGYALPYIVSGCLLGHDTNLNTDSVSCTSAPAIERESAIRQ